MKRPRHPRYPQDAHAARLRVEEAVGRAVRVPALSDSALLPVGNCSIQIRTIDPDAPEAWRPNGRQVS